MREVQAKYGLIGPELDLVENIKLVLDKRNQIIEIEELNRDLKTYDVLFPGFFNGHVHSADIGLRGIINNYSLQALVDPGGIKHTHLDNLSTPETQKAILQTYSEALNNGILGWSDFREGGLKIFESYPIKNQQFKVFC